MQVAIGAPRVWPVDVQGVEARRHVLFEEKLIYFPSKYPEGVWEAPGMQIETGGAPPEVSDCWFRTEDGMRLHGWYCRHRKENRACSVLAGEMVLVFFHGNAGNVTHRYDMIVRLTNIPIDVFIVDYRGYGKSQGRPSEHGLYRDARAAWTYLLDACGIGANRIVLFGKSMGGAVAIDLATQVESAGLVVQSSFTSIPDMARHMIPFLPDFFIHTKMDSVRKVPGVSCPKLFIHSPADEVVPFRFGCRLFAVASEPKEFYEVPNARHNETYKVGGEAYIDALRHFIRFCSNQRTQP